MTNTITRYLTRTFLVRVLSVLFALSALLQLLDLLDAASSVLQRGGGAGDLIRYTVLRMPMIVERVVPLAVLIGSLSTLWSFAATNEFVAMRSVGMTPYQIMGALMPAALVVAGLHFLLTDQIAPRSERAFVTWWASTQDPEGDEAAKPEPIWFRLGNAVVGLSDIGDDGQSLKGLEYVERDSRGKATLILQAKNGVWQDGKWQLSGVSRTRVGTPLVVDQLPALEWTPPLTPANLIELKAPTQSISVNRLLRILHGAWAGSQSQAYYATRLHATYAGPLGSLVMLLLAAPVAHGLRRRGGAMGSLALGVVIGLAFLLSSGILSSMGQAGAMPPWIAVWSPVLLFTAIGGAIMVHVEG